MTKKITGPVSMYLVNAAMIWLANLAFPQDFILGSHLITPTKAIFASALIWTVLTWQTQPILKLLKLDKYSGVMAMMLSYLAVNIVSLWLITRVSAYTGVGVSSFSLLFVFAFIANTVQYLNYSLMTKLKLAVM